MIYWLRAAGALPSIYPGQGAVEEQNEGPEKWGRPGRECAALGTGGYFISPCPEALAQARMNPVEGPSREKKGIIGKCHT